MAASARHTHPHRTTALTVRCNIQETEKQHSVFPGVTLCRYPLQNHLRRCVETKRISIRKIMGTDQRWTRNKKAGNGPTKEGWRQPSESLNNLTQLGCFSSSTQISVRYKRSEDVPSPSAGRWPCRLLVVTQINLVARDAAILGVPYLLVSPSLAVAWCGLAWAHL